MTQEQLATGIGASLGIALSAVAYTTLPVYHNFVVWSWGLVGVDMVSWIGF
jgi:hypothetical protein